MNFGLGSFSIRKANGSDSFEFSLSSGAIHLSQAIKFEIELSIPIVSIAWISPIISKSMTYGSSIRIMYLSPLNAAHQSRASASRLDGPVRLPNGY